MNKERFLKLHGNLALQMVVKAGQETDRLWLGEGHLERLEELRRILSWCQEHSDPRVFDLGRHQQLIKPNLSQEQFLAVLVPLERAYTRGVVDHDIEVIEGDRIPISSGTSPISIILDNIRSAFNVGSAFRTCECFGAKHVYLCGYTASPENTKTQKTSMGTADYVPWSHHKNTLELIQTLKAQDSSINIYGVETARNSSSLYEIELKFPALFIFGNERHGLSPDILDACDDIIQIPLIGAKNSLNVGVSIGICLNESLRQRHNYYR